MRGGIRLVRTIGWVLLLAAPSLGLSAAEVDAALPRELQTAVSANLRKVKVAEGAIPRSIPATASPCASARAG